MFRSRSARSRRLRFLVSLACCLALFPASGRAVRAEPVMATRSTATTIASASFIGAGLALVFAGAVVEGRYEKVVGYHEIDGFRYPITIEGGSDTNGMVLVGAAFALVGAAILINPLAGGEPAAPAGNPEITVRTTRVAGVPACGVALDF